MWRGVYPLTPVVYAHDRRVIISFNNTNDKFVQNIQKLHTETLQGTVHKTLKAIINVHEQNELINLNKTHRYCRLRGSKICNIYIIYEFIFLTNCSFNRQHCTNLSYLSFRFGFIDFFSLFVSVA